MMAKKNQSNSKEADRRPSGWPKPNPTLKRLEKLVGS